MATRNYRQAKRQKEEARKTRQLQKQQKRTERPAEDGAAPGIDTGVTDGSAGAATTPSES